MERRNGFQLWPLSRTQVFATALHPLSREGTGHMPASAQASMGIRQRARAWCWMSSFKEKHAYVDVKRTENIKENHLFASKNKVVTLPKESFFSLCSSLLYSSFLRFCFYHLFSRAAPHAGHCRKWRSSPQSFHQAVVSRRSTRCWRPSVHWWSPSWRGHSLRLGRGWTG